MIDKHLAPPFFHLFRTAPKKRTGIKEERSKAMDGAKARVSCRKTVVKRPKALPQALGGTWSTKKAKRAGKRNPKPRPQPAMRPKVEGQFPVRHKAKRLEVIRKRPLVISGSRQNRSDKPRNGESKTKIAARLNEAKARSTFAPDLNSPARAKPKANCPNQRTWLIPLYKRDKPVLRAKEPHFLELLS